MIPINVLFFDLGGTLVVQVPGQQRVQWIDGAKEILRELSDRNVRLGLLSNTGTFQRDELFATLLPTDFPRASFEEKLMILSAEVGAEKPQLRIFAHAIDAAATLPGRCLFCTEEIAHALAAQEVGMRSIWLRPDAIRPLVEELLSKALLDTA